VTFSPPSAEFESISSKSEPTSESQKYRLESDSDTGGLEYYITGVYLLYFSLHYLLLHIYSIHTPLNLRGLILLVMMVWSKRGNINTAAVVTIAQCNTLVARRSRQLIGPADWVFVTLGPLLCD